VRPTFNNPDFSTALILVLEISVPEGKEADLRCGCGRRRRTISGVRYGSVKGFIEDLKRLIEEVCCAV
jgi:hypothetical protein